jgi:hypothetical protein
MRRLLSSLAALVVITVICLLWRRATPVVPQGSATAIGSLVSPGATTAPASAPGSTPAPDSTLTVSPAGAAPTSGSGEARITLADSLNAPESDIHHDLLVLQDIFIAWRTNYPHDGNPVGENNEITAALTGKNTLQLALIPPDHPAINQHGELCDRWGTPFLFHQLSGTRMEIRSAGPDRKFGTPDDAILTP